MACLDTTMLLDLQGRAGRRAQAHAERAIRGLAAAGEAFVTTRFNVAEVWVGIERSRDRDRELRKLKNSLAWIPVLEFDEAAAMRYGVITAALQRIGRPAGDMDVLIASVALVAGETLLTRNARHFADVPGLVVISY